MAGIMETKSFTETWTLTFEFFDRTGFEIRFLTFYRKLWNEPLEVYLLAWEFNYQKSKFYILPSK